MSHLFCFLHGRLTIKKATTNKNSRDSFRFSER